MSLDRSSLLLLLPTVAQPLEASFSPISLFFTWPLDLRRDWRAVEVLSEVLCLVESLWQRRGRPGNGESDI
jgi:hypothetical protein